MTALEIIFKEYEMLLSYLKEVDLSNNKGASVNYDLRLSNRLETLRSQIDTLTSKKIEAEGNQPYAHI